MANFLHALFGDTAQREAYTCGQYRAALRNAGDRGLEPSSRAFWREEADGLREILPGDS